jgi:2-hydroxy-6-oxonona-2,4-dienedioate hydrolase
LAGALQAWSDRRYLLARRWITSFRTTGPGMQIGALGELVGRRDQVGPYVLFSRVNADPPAAPDAPPIVLVHGLGVSSRYFVPTARLLAAHHWVYAPDLPGFGQTPCPRTVLSIPELADTLAHWMDVVGLPRAAFVGNSLGCQVVVDLAARHGSRVQAAILTGPALDPRVGSKLRHVGRLLLDSLREPWSLNALVAWEYLQAGPRRVWQTFKMGLADPMEKKLPQVEAPVLVVRGEHDPIAPQRWVEEMAALAPHGAYAVIPGGAHTVNYTSPQELASLVLKFVNQGERHLHDPRVEASRPLGG